MPKIVINKSFDEFFISHKAFVKLRELGQPEALQEADPGAYWPEAATPREPSLNRCGALIPRDDEKLVQLGTLKEVRQALMSLAELQGKLNRKVEISLNLSESPQFIQLRQIILSVLDRHPEAKADFLQEMRVLQVIDAKAVPA